MGLLKKVGRKIQKYIVPRREVFEKGHKSIGQNIKSGAKQVGQAVANPIKAAVPHFQKAVSTSKFPVNARASAAGRLARDARGWK